MSVGRPIHVEKSEKPGLEEVMRVQKMYIEELTRCVINLSLCLCSKVVMPFPIVARAHRIWNTYKNEFAKARLRELSIID